MLERFDTKHSETMKGGGYVNESGPFLNESIVCFFFTSVTGMDILTHIFTHFPHHFDFI